MEQLLVAGIDSVVGGNLAARLGHRFHVVGVSQAGSVSADGRPTAAIPANDPHAVHAMASTCRPDRIVVCGIAGDSPWRPGGVGITESAIVMVRRWARAAHELGCRFTLIASDAIFTGPWMFHAETSSSLCQSDAARALRAAEAAVLEECPTALIARTHPYGWSQQSGEAGWIEGLLAALESDRPLAFDCASHATPILATDLADVLLGAWNADLSGTYHIAGAERTNPHAFVRALAEVFELPPPRAARPGFAEETQSACALRETSLHTRKIRGALRISMPLLVDGLKRLRDQRRGGRGDRSRSSRPLTRAKVA